MTNFEFLRERLLKRAGLIPPPKPRFKPSDLAKLKQTEWSSQFEQLMRNRLVMGAFRYGTFEDKAKLRTDPWNLLEPVTSKVEKYQQTGNTEYLVDAANYLLLAFEFDPHPLKHFLALDDTDHCKKKKVGYFRKLSHSK